MLPLLYKNLSISQVPDRRNERRTWPVKRGDGRKKWEIYGAESGKPGKRCAGKTAGGAEKERKSGNRATESETKKVTEEKVRREKTEKRPYERKMRYVKNDRERKTKKR